MIFPQTQSELRTEDTEEKGKLEDGKGRDKGHYLERNGERVQGNSKRRG